MKNNAIITGKSQVLTQRAVDEEDNEPQMKPLEWGLFLRLWSYTSAHKSHRNWLLVLTVLRAVQLPAIVWMSSRLIAGPIAHHETKLIFSGLVGYVLLGLITDFCFHFRQRLALELGEKVVGKLREEIFDHVQRMPMSFFHRVKLGRIISRVTSDTEALRAGIQDAFFISIVQAGQMVIAAGFMAWRDWQLFMIVLAMAPILWMINRKFRGRLSRYSRAQQESFSRITATLAESVNGVRVTQGFVRQEANAGLFRRLLDDHSRTGVALARTSAVLNPLLELNSQFFVASLLVFGGWSVLHGGTQINVLIEFLFFANQFFSPIQILGIQYNHGLVAMASAERVFSLLDTKPDWVDAPDAKALPDVRTNPASGAPAGVKIEFREVGFFYVKDRPVLEKLSFIAEPGMMVALVGHTGSGKSTIINLVSKFYLPTSGELLIDGHNILSISSASLHAQMGIVQQQNFLFSGTVIDNIRHGRPDASEEEVRAAASALDCLDILESLPNGLHSQLGEKGSGLSSGQRQVICFARAMLANPRLLILDEATSAIDTLTENRLQVALSRLLRGRTSLVVAHRLSTVRKADLVLVLDHGRVVESGNHESLLSKNGQYASAWRQFTSA